MKSKFLPFMCRLRRGFFEIDAYLGSTGTYDLSHYMGSFRISLTSPATLEHLKFNVQLRGFNFDRRFHEDLRDSDVWRHLNSISTHPNGSRLRRVDINIKLTYHLYHGELKEPEVDKVKKVVNLMVNVTLHMSSLHIEYGDEL